MTAIFPNSLAYYIKVFGTCLLGKDPAFIWYNAHCQRVLTVKDMRPIALINEFCAPGHLCIPLDYLTFAVYNVNVIEKRRQSNVAMTALVLRVVTNVFSVNGWTRTSFYQTGGETTFCRLNEESQAWTIPIPSVNKYKTRNKNEIKEWGWGLGGGDRKKNSNLIYKWVHINTNDDVASRHMHYDVAFGQEIIFCYYLAHGCISAHSVRAKVRQRHYGCLLVVVLGSLTTLQHFSGHFGRGQLTYPHWSWASLLGSLPELSVHSFVSNW